jgi:hypothetical protein
MSEAGARRVSQVRPRRLLEPEFWEVIQAMGPTVETLEWRVGEHAEGHGPSGAAGRLFHWGDTGEWVSGKAFLEIAVEDVELFGGEVSARKPGAQGTAVTLRAMSNKGWEVETADPSLVSQLQDAYPDAVARPQGGLWIPHGSRRRDPEAGERARAEADEARNNERAAPDPFDEIFGERKPGPQRKT